MNIKHTKWHCPDFDWHTLSRLVKELSISPITAKVLLNRGISSAEEGRVFFHGTLADLSSPWDLSGMEAAVSRILRGIKDKEKMMVFGDYDVDGITATAIVVSFLRNQGVPVGYYIPERSQGYGLNIDALRAIHQQGYSLIITVDCGISAIPEIVYGKELGLDFVVTDHHEPGAEIPDCEGIINPKIDNSKSCVAELAGVGVAFKLLQALAEKLRLDPAYPFDYLDLVALGTIADVVPLIGENRIIVKNGLTLLSKSSREGIKALLEVAGVGEGQLTPNQVAFALAPRLNSAGRLASPLIALELLLTKSPQKARELALKLNELNATRQLLVQQVMQEVLAMIEQESQGDPENPVIVLASPLWHPGVTGIVAAKLADMFYKPVILLTIEGEQAKGSGRSIPGFDLFQGIKHCEELLLKAGGHSQAVGLTVAVEYLAVFREKINSYAENLLEPAVLEPTLHIEAEVLPHQLDFQLLDELLMLEPFGYGNPEPVLALRSACIRDYRPVGKEGEHLKFQIVTGGEAIDGIGFNMVKPVQGKIDLRKPVDLAFRLQRNHWNGHTTLQLVLEDIKPYRETKPQINTAQIHDEAKPIETTAATYQCLHGREQFELLLQFVLAEVKQRTPIYLVFPTQRLLAVYERMLVDSLNSYSISCERYHYQGNASSNCQVFLAPKHLFSSPKDAQVFRLVLPGWDDKSLAGKDEQDLLLGFRQLEPAALNFIREPILAQDKLAFLGELVKREPEPLFIYTNRINQAVQLYQELQLLFPDRKHRIWYYHQALSPTQREMVVNAVSHGLADIIVASEFIELQIPEKHGPGTRVIVDAPYSIEELYVKSRPLKPGMKIFGIWHQEELYRNELVLQAIFPEGKPLEELLLSLREMGAGLEDNLTEIMNELRKKFNGIQGPTVQYGLEIIHDLAGSSFKTLDYQIATTYQAAQAEKKALEKLKYLEQNGGYISYLVKGAP